VISAIATNKRDCFACHDESVHDPDHGNPLDANCKTCHSNTVNRLHTNPGFVCETCHVSSNAKLNRAVNNNDLNCAACHPKSLKHNVILEDRVPDDIPLYAGFQWSNPKEASIFIGVLGFPVGYESGLMVISKRKANIAVGDVWTYYNTSLTASGWILNSSAPEADAAAFSVEFAKVDRRLIVKCFRTDKRDGSGVNLGTRIELWYK
jgi:hypothetical protein